MKTLKRFIEISIERLKLIDIIGLLIGLIVLSQAFRVIVYLFGIEPSWGLFMAIAICGETIGFSRSVIVDIIKENKSFGKVL